MKHPRQNALPQEVLKDAFDVTEQLNLEARLCQSKKLESIGQLAASIAHDFNNILTVIQGYSGILLEQELEPDIRDSVKQISSATERAACLIRQLLLFSRKQTLSTQKVNLNDIIIDMPRFLHRILGENIVLHLNYSPNLPFIQADPGMIGQVITNLAVNARDVLPKGGVLTIGTHPATVNKNHVRFNPGARPGQYVCLRVNDTGDGIDDDALAHIFEPFFTTKATGKGTGLGLATVYRIVEQHRGWIDVLTEKGKGTTFRIFFPAITP